MYTAPRLRIVTFVDAKYSYTQVLLHDYIERMRACDPVRVCRNVYICVLVRTGTTMKAKDDGQNGPRMNLGRRVSLSKCVEVDGEDVAQTVSHTHVASATSH